MSETSTTNRTLDEICGILLVRYDAELLIELLQISATELLERFEDKLTEHYDELNKELDE